MVLASPNDQKYPRYLLLLNINATLARPLLNFVFLNGNSCQMIGACILMAANESRDPCGWADPYKIIAKLILHSILPSDLLCYSENDKMRTFAEYLIIFPAS